MVSTKEKESTKKLVKFIVIVTLAYLAFLQIGTLVHLFLIKEKSVSYGISKEDAPIPAVTLCIRTNEFTRKDVLDKYKVTELLLERDPDKIRADTTNKLVKSKWKNFDWDSVSLKQLYNESVIYPQEITSICQVGENYNCTQYEGLYHLWENTLKRSYSCSTLKVFKKNVAYGEQTTVNIQLERNKFIRLDVQIHDVSKYVPRYINKHLDYEHDNEGQTDNYYGDGAQWQSHHIFTVEKEGKLPENKGRSCSENLIIDRVKCEEDCFENQLLQGNSSCVLPWVMSPGRQCSSLDEALEMIKKEKELHNIPCDCQNPCKDFKYILDSKAVMSATTSGDKVIIDNTNGIVTVEESYMFTLIDLLATSGGSLGVFFSVSLLWLLEKIINTIGTLESFSKFLSTRFMKNLVGYLLTASSLACLAIFLYEGAHLISKYLQNSKMLAIDRLDPLQYTLPNIMICNKDLVIPEYELSENYIESLFPLPILQMTECHLDNETCMTNGSLFSWENSYSVFYSCSMLLFKDGARYKNLEILFDNGFANFHIYLVSWDRTPRYGVKMNNFYFTLRQTDFMSIAYFTEQNSQFPPCTDNNIQCLERCWEEKYLKEDLCSPPEMPPTVKYKPCNTTKQLGYLLDYVSIKPHCQCEDQCSEIIFHGRPTADLYDNYRSKLFVSLVPFKLTRTSEEWAYPFNSFLAGVGGVLGLLTGMSFSSILLESFVKILAWKRMGCADISLTKSVGKTIIRLVIWGWFLQQAYTTISRYIESPVKMSKRIDKGSLTVLPDFIFCDFSPKVTLWTRDIYIYNGDGYQMFNSYTVNQTDWSGSWFNLENFLKDCTIFGIPCNHQKGEIHEWHPMPNVNRFCSRLEIKPLMLRHYKDNRLIITPSRTIQFFVAKKEENRLFHLDKALDVYYPMNTYFKSIFEFRQNVYELLEEKPNNCINRLGYNRRNCLDQCVLDNVLDTLKCRFPWMEIQRSLPICKEFSEYTYFYSIDSTFLAGCQCLPPCQYTDNHLKLMYEHSLSSNEDGIALIRLKESKDVFKESWSYPASQCLADLGGLMAMFMGITLYDIIFP